MVIASWSGVLFDRSNLLNEYDLRNIVVVDRLRNDVPPKLESKINVMAKIPEKRPSKYSTQ